MTEALEKFRKGLSQEQQGRLQAISKGTPAAQDVVHLLGEIDEKNSARRSRVWAQRMQDILNSVQQYCSIVDTFIQADPEIAALVWGSVKFVILVMTLQLQPTTAAMALRAACSRILNKDIKQKNPSIRLDIH